MDLVRPKDINKWLVDLGVISESDPVKASSIQLGIAGITPRAARAKWYLPPASHSRIFRIMRRFFVANALILQNVSRSRSTSKLTDI